MDFHEWEHSEGLDWTCIRCGCIFSIVQSPPNDIKMIIEEYESSPSRQLNQLLNLTNDLKKAFNNHLAGSQIFPDECDSKDMVTVGMSYSSKDLYNKKFFHARLNIKDLNPDQILMSCSQILMHKLMNS